MYKSSFQMDTLPTELVLQLCKEMSLRDILHLQKTSLVLHNKICHVSEAIVIYKLQKQGLSFNDIHILLSHFLQTYYDNIQGEMLRKYADQLYTNTCYQLISNMLLDNLANNSIDLHLTKSKGINAIFRKMLYFYITNDSLKDYDNQLEVYLFYLLLQIDILKNSKQVNTLIDTFYEFEHYKMKNDKSLVFNNCLDNYIEFLIENNIDVKFNTLHKMSKTYTTIPMLNKLFGSKYLELKNTKLMVCCKSCVISNLRDIVAFKFNRPTDYFMSFNYRALKDFLKRENKQFYNDMIKYERYHINKNITVTHPHNLTKMYVSSFQFKKFFYKLQFEQQNNKNVSKLVSYISQKQIELKHYHFS